MEELTGSKPKVDENSNSAKVVDNADYFDHEDESIYERYYENN